MKTPFPSNFYSVRPARRACPDRSVLSRLGFTIIEMLVVITIIVAILLIAVPSINSVIQANRLTAAGEQLLSLISTSQQMAIADGRPGEVRMLKYTNVGGTGVPAFQTILLLHHYSLGEMGPDSIIVSANEGISVLAADPMILPAGIVVSASKNLGISNITIDQRLTASSGDGTATGGQISSGQLKVISQGKLQDYNLNYVQSLSATCSVVMYPDGTSLPDPSASWYFSLVDEKDEVNQKEDFNSVHNFYCIQIDPYNGHPTSYRP